MTGFPLRLPIDGVCARRIALLHPAEGMGTAIHGDADATIQPRMLVIEIKSDAEARAIRDFLAIPDAAVNEKVVA